MSNVACIVLCALVALDVKNGIAAELDYQDIKPLTKGDHVCLITNTREGDYSKKCNMQVPFIPNSEEEKEKAVALCGTREVYILKPESCEALGTALHMQNLSLGSRKIEITSGQTTVSQPSTDINLRRAACSYKKVPKPYSLKEET